MPYPDGPVIPGGEIERLLETYPNLYCDISANSGLRALSRDTEYTKGFLTRFRTRVLYGRDYYYNKHREFLDSLGLEKDVLDGIYYKNALRLIHEA
jgi:predicted TIM-barrel fold metal-dependent hydrolase